MGEEYLHGELRTTKPLPIKYHIKAENEGFVCEDGTVYRVGEVWRRCVDKRTGGELSREKMKQNHARVLYDISNLVITEQPPCAKRDTDFLPGTEPPCASVTQND